MPDDLPLLPRSDALSPGASARSAMLCVLASVPCRPGVRPGGGTVLADGAIGHRDDQNRNLPQGSESEVGKMELGPNEFWAVVYDTHDGVMRVISDEDGVPYLYKGKNNAVSHRRTMPAELLKPYVARVRVEVAR